MKNIFKSFLAFAAGVVMFSACQSEQDPLSASIAASQTEVTLAGDSFDSQTINVTADGDWIIINAAEWLEVTPSTGTGNTTVTLSVAKLNVDSYSELNGPRSEKIYLFGNEEQVVITVNQIGENGLDASRTYRKISSTSDIEADKGYLIVANDGSALQAAKGFSASSESTYAYLYTDKVEESSTGVIERSNANNGFILSDAGDGLYYIAMPNGRYLFQAASYNNFYSTTDKTKADKWEITFDDKGQAVITNKGAAAGKYFQYSISYTSYGAYGSAQDKSALPYLYKDSAAPSDEILEVASSTKVGAKLTSVSIPVTSNKTWKVRNHDSWIKSFTASGTGNGSIDITFDANTSQTDTRVATFQIIGETTNFQVTLTQDMYHPITDLGTLAEFNALEDSEDLYRVSGLVSRVANTTYGNIYIKDATDQIYAYGLCSDEKMTYKSYSEIGLQEHDIVTVVGYKSTYNTTKQFIGYYESHISPKHVSFAEFNAADDDADVYYELTGTITEIANDKYGNVYITDGTDKVYVWGVYSGWNPPTNEQKQNVLKNLNIEVGDELTVIGYKSSYKGSPQMVGGFYVSHQKNTISSPIVLTTASLPTSYPDPEATITETSVDYYIYKVVNFGNGIQMKKEGSYIANKTAVPSAIRTITITCESSKTWYPNNVTVYAGTVEKPSGTALTPTVDTEAKTSTYDLSGQNYTYFYITNASNFAVYLSKVEVTF